MAGVAAIGVSVLHGASASAQSRFLSYDSESDCLASHVLAGALCHSAFANARSEFEAKTPSFASLAQCAKTYGDCAPWPPGRASTSSFRPRWEGVDIVDTPHEKSVTPAVASGPKRLAFAPQPLTEFRNLDVRGARPPAGKVGIQPQGRPESRNPFGNQPQDAPSGTSSPPPPGSGFKLEDGVLTYPAPARFQPKNLPKPPP